MGISGERAIAAPMGIGDGRLNVAAMNLAFVLATHGNAWSDRVGVSAS
ncbi:MAG: hypothetical protein IPI49_23150 [Myxococcales bacterium]|nr:hypothetical protein [Myxococcales bacterium]